ncbi:hypothetical protein A3C67_02535 [Candidatus Nomurabacteria bacterium RIFCSPHIGHO2_02_FULL_42_19]|uniref:DUF998 domain-containing protein n=1 Tax=Candidatus Nomurabacteria bacterium RIFCSPHIGHO2_02_FULL_42_19 TaxID=1801756 RepID=A0A1F6W154_9BACT|nr:MAG: hypothetical protein A3C67_02535 [Candidatus Nomurabacteria bacterium RIFCSPHIGHO2_02_FULL_42_19]
METKQKTWLWISLAMFVVPEALWNPILNFSYSFFENSTNPIILRPNFLITPDYRNLVIFVIFIQLMGLISSLIIISKSNLTFSYKILLILLILFLIAVTGFVFFITFSLRHGIGF